MNQIATITSKRQLTIPSQLFRAMGLKEGQKVVLSHQDDVLVLKPVLYTIDKLAGSVVIPKHYQSLEIDEMIRRAKNEYQKRRI